MVKENGKERIRKAGLKGKCNVRNAGGQNLLKQQSRDN